MLRTTPIHLGTLRAVATWVAALGCSWLWASDLRPTLQRAQDAYDAGRVEQALEVYEALVGTKGESPRVHAGIAASASRLGRYPRAIEAYHHAIALSPDNAVLMGDLANAYLRLRRLDQADEWYRRALRATDTPPHGDWYIGLGLVASQRADFATAQAQFEHAIAANPASARAYYNLGLALLSQNQLEAADSALVAAIKRDRDIAPAYFARGRIAMRQKDWTRALPLLERAVSDRPEDASYFYTLSQAQFRLRMWEAGHQSLAAFREARARFFYEEGHTLLSRSAWKDALGWLERALALEPALTEALRDRAHCLLQLGDAEGARRGYEAVLRQDSTSVHATYYLGVAQLLLGDHEAAEVQFVETVQRAPGFADGYRQLAQVREQTGDLAGAEDALTQGLQRDPSWSAGHWLRGLVQCRRERWIDAEADFRKSIGLAPEEARPRAALARLLAERGKDLREALALATDALSIDPTAESRATLALVLHHMDDPVGARREIAEAVDDAPDNPVVRRVVAQIESRR